MSETPVVVTAGANGDVVIRLHGDVGEDATAELRHTLVHIIRRTRPSMLIIDLGEVTRLDPINIGVLVAVAQLADDHATTIVLTCDNDEVTHGLRAAGLPADLLRTRHVGPRITDARPTTQTPS